MGLGGALRELGRFLDECEHHREVTSVDLAADCCPGSTGRMVAEVEVALPVCSSNNGGSTVSLGGASVTDDGRLELRFESVEDVVPARPAGIELELADATFECDGTVTATLAASTTIGAAAAGGSAAVGSDASPDSTKGDGHGPDERPLDGGFAERPTRSEVGDSHRSEVGDSHRSEVGDSHRAEVGDSTAWDVPPFENPELLQEIYESCDTFAEMPDALGMDVTAETVRRYMIDHGIHEPDSYDTGTDDAAEDDPAETDADVHEPVVLADGVGLPDDVTVDVLVEMIQRSDTIYEASTELGIGRAETVEMLQRLDLVGYVTGRLAEAGRREVTREEVLERLREYDEPN